MKLCVFIILIYVSRCRGVATDLATAEGSCIGGNNQATSAEYAQIKLADPTKNTVAETVAVCLFTALEIKDASSAFSDDKLFKFYGDIPSKKVITKKCLKDHETKTPIDDKIKEIFKCFYTEIKAKDEFTKAEISCTNTENLAEFVKGNPLKIDSTFVTCMDTALTMIASGGTDLNEAKLKTEFGKNTLTKNITEVCITKSTTVATNKDDFLKCYYEDINKQPAKAEIECVWKSDGIKEKYAKVVGGDFSVVTPAELSALATCIFTSYTALDDPPTTYTKAKLTDLHSNGTKITACENENENETPLQDRAAKVFKCIFTKPVVTPPSSGGENSSVVGTPAAGSVTTPAPGAAAPGAAAPGAAALPACDDTPKKDKHVAHFKVYLQTPKPKKKSQKNKKNKIKVRPLKKEKNLDEEDENDDTK